MADLYAERVEAELQPTEDALLFLVVTYVVVNGKVVLDVTGHALTCDLCVRRVHVSHLGICIHRKTRGFHA